MAPRRTGPIGQSPRQFREGAVLNTSTNLKVTQAGLEPWIVPTPTLKVYQAGLEPWVRNTPTLKVYQIGIEAWVLAQRAPDGIKRSNPVGPRGMIGVPVKRFRERERVSSLTTVQVTQIGVEAWFPPTFARVTQIGLEAWSLPSVTLQVMQMGLEAWALPSATIQVTQLGLEAWAWGSAALRVTAVGIEAWVTTNPAPESIHGHQAIGPTGLLGIPIRRFRERTLDIGSTLRVTQIGIEAWVQPNSALDVTQVGLEIWSTSALFSRRWSQVFYL